MSIDDKVNEKGKKKRFLLDTILGSGTAIGGAAVGAAIGSALGPIGTAVGAVAGDIVGHIFGFSLPWYIQHRDKGIYQNIKDLAGIHTRNILPYVGHSLIEGPLAYLGKIYTNFKPALVGAGAAIGSEVAYTGLSYLANLGKIKSPEKNNPTESYKTPNTIPYPQSKQAMRRAA